MGFTASSVHRNKKQLFSTHYHSFSANVETLMQKFKYLGRRDLDELEEGRECHVLDMPDVSELSSLPLCLHSLP